VLEIAFATAESGRMFRQPGQWRERIRAIAQRFREKGATTPDKAMTAQELGLPQRFEDAMKRRLGQTGIFVDVGGRYYLNEERLREFEQRRQGGWAAYGGMSSARRNMFAVRIIRMILGILILSLVLVNYLFGRSTLLWIAIVILIVVWICISVLQIYYIANVRRRGRFGESSNYQV
jgi:hypothetical protein